MHEDDLSDSATKEACRVTYLSQCSARREIRTFLFALGSTFKVEFSTIAACP